MLFRKFLIRIRKEYHTNQKQLFLYTAIASTLSILLGIAADAFIPFGGWFNLIRTALLIPTSISIFALLYSCGLKMHYRKVESDPDWKPFRSRSSPSWRRRISAVVAAMGFIFVFANGYRIGYTLISSLFVVLVIALFAYMRLTREEDKREMFDITDPRDTQYQTHRRKMEKTRQEAIAKRAKIKAEKRGR